MPILSDEITGESAVLSALSPKALTRQMESVEDFIRSQTNNTFHERESRLTAEISGGVVVASSEFYSAGDRVEIINGINHGLYDVLSVENGVMTLDRPLRGSMPVTMYRIVYPISVQDGVLTLLEYKNDKNVKRREGIKNESISRHSVGYEDVNGAGGYPERLLSFLDGYRRARF